MKRYPAYKDSGVEWIGEIPVNWSKKKLKFFSRIVLGKMLTTEDKGGYFYKPYLRAQNINWFNVNSGDIKEMWFSENELSQYRINKDDLLVSEGGEVGRTCMWNNEIGECYIQNSVHKVTVNGDNFPRFFQYSFFALGSIGHFDAIVSRVSIAHLTREKLKEVSFIVPDKQQQSIIVSFLDHKASQIDDLIDKKLKLIDLLKEERTAIINQAVTKGLDPTVPMKDSGIEWLGEIPEHWFVERLKFLVDNIIEKSNTSGFKVALENIESWAGRYLKTESPSELTGEMKSFKPNDVLFNKLRPYLAKVYLSEVEGECVGELLVLRPKANINPKFLYYRLLSCDFIEVVNSSTYGAKMPRASWEDFIRNLSIPYPDILEQEMIVESIEKMSVTIADTTAKFEHEIELISEYKTSLINEVVTGKIDISDAN